MFDGLSALMGREHSAEHTHLVYIPLLLLVGSNSPILIETVCYWCTSYRPATPLNVVFLLHRSTEIFMVMLTAHAYS